MMLRFSGASFFKPRHQGREQKKTRSRATKTERKTEARTESEKRRANLKTQIGAIANKPNQTDWVRFASMIDNLNIVRTQSRAIAKQIDFVKSF